MLFSFVFTEPKFSGKRRGGNSKSRNSQGFCSHCRQALIAKYKATAVDKREEFSEITCGQSFKDVLLCVFLQLGEDLVGFTSLMGAVMKDKLQFRIIFYT